MQILLGLYREQYNLFQAKRTDKFDSVFCDPNYKHTKYARFN